MTIIGYSDAVEYQMGLNETKDTLLRIQKMKKLADAGNAQAALWYAKILMAGQWDISQMSRDFINSELLPAKSDSTLDPYLLYPRDQQRAIQYLRVAAGCAKEGEEVDEARGILAYCQTKSDVGYNRSCPKDTHHIKFYEKLEKKNSGMLDFEHAPFLPWPYRRPLVEDPRKSIVARVAVSMEKLCYKQLEIAVLYPCLYIACLFLLIKFNPIVIIIIILVLFALPLYAFARLYRRYGVDGKVACCQCAKFCEAYRLHVERMLQGDYEIEPYPFKTVPFIARNLTNIKLTYFILILFSSCAILLLNERIESYLNQYFRSDMNTLLYCSLSVIFSSTLCLALERTGWYNESCVKVCDEIKEIEFDLLQQV